MITRATSISSVTVPCADMPSAAFDVTVATMHGADIGAL
jgi:hypothetical protein